MRLIFSFDKGDVMLRHVLFFLCCALFLGACSSQISDGAVKKYENGLNAEFKKTLLQIVDNKNVRVEADDFVCRADGKFVICENFTFALLEKNPRDGVKLEEIVRSQGFVLRSNQLYLGDREGNVSLKDAVDNMFENNEKIQVSIRMKSFKIGEKLTREIKAAQRFFVKDVKIAELVQGWVEDSYDLELNYDVAQNEKNYDWTMNFTFGNAKDNHIKISKRASVSKDLWAIAGDELLFDTDVQNVSEQGLKKFVEDDDERALKILQLIKPQNLQIDTSLQTNDVFKPYLTMAKGYLQTLKNRQEIDEKRIVLFDKVANLMDKMDKSSIYRSNLELLFKDDFSVADFSGVAPENLIKKIILNGEDFSEILQMSSELW